MDKLLGIKFLDSNDNGACFNKCKYDISGAWNSLTSRKKAIRCCEYGYHAAIIDSIEYYYDNYFSTGGSCYIVELSGKIDVNTYNFEDAKIAAENIRFIHKIKLTGNPSINISHIRNIAKKFKVLNYNDLINIPIGPTGIRRWDSSCTLKTM